MTLDKRKKNKKNNCVWIILSLIGIIAFNVFLSVFSLVIEMTGKVITGFWISHVIATVAIPMIFYGFKDVIK